MSEMAHGKSRGPIMKPHGTILENSLVLLSNAGLLLDKSGARFSYFEVSVYQWAGYSFLLLSESKSRYSLLVCVQLPWCFCSRFMP